RGMAAETIGRIPGAQAVARGVLDILRHGLCTHGQVNSSQRVVVAYAAFVVGSIALEYVGLARLSAAESPQQSRCKGLTSSRHGQYASVSIARNSRVVAGLVEFQLWILPQDLRICNRGQGSRHWCVPKTRCEVAVAVSAKLLVRGG